MIRCIAGGLIWLADPNQILLKPYVTYKRLEVISNSFGYTYIKSSPYGDSPIQIDFPEHNLWEQIILNHKVGSVQVSHRYRLENRFLAKLETSNQLNGFTFANRFRYRITLIQPITQLIFLHLFNEFWLRMNGDFSAATNDRNWIYIGLGYKLSEFSNLQLAYLHQHIATQNQFEVHPSLQLSLQVDFGK